MKVEYHSVADIGEIVTGKTPLTEKPEYWDGTIPFITPTDIVGYDMCYIFDTERRITDAGANTQKKTIIPRNSICVSCIASIGKMCITSSERSITNQQINSIVVRKSYDYRYIFYLLRHFLPYLQLIGGGTGSGTPIISKTKFSKIKYPVCDDFQLQKRVADILFAYDNLIEVNNKRIKVLEQMAENLYKEWFVRFRFPGHESVPFENGIPKGWTRDRISKYYHTSSGGTPSRDNDEEFYGGRIPWIKTGELQDCLIIDTEEHITETAIKKTSAKVFPKDSVLMAMYGVNIGMLAYSTIEATCNQACCVFTDKGTNSTKHYLFQCLKSIRDYLLLIGFGAAQQNLSQDLIKRIRIIMPDQDTVTRFEQLIEPLYIEAKYLISANANLIKQRDLLLPRLMSGKLEV